MTTTTEETTTDRAEALRGEVIALCDALIDRAGAYELPSPPEALGVYRQKLVANDHLVLVAGEAKRGKSTFVNALIGRPLLPTNVAVATSQVFRVRHANREAYRLRFEDNSTQAIDAAGLARHGSQVEADRAAETGDGPPPLNEVLRWIEVDVPMQFLPANVSLLDTPGVGALYAAHAEVIQRFVPRADAVIYVLDSKSPITHEETSFVGQLLEVTRNIFFIQTMIDVCHEEEWQDIRQRNEDALGRHFGERLANTRIWPIASTLLQLAAETGDDDFAQESQHRELIAALEAFLYRVGGWSRTADALALAYQYFGTGRQTLAGRLTAIGETSKQRRLEMQQDMQRHKQTFDTEWGQAGTKRRDLLMEAQRICNLGRTEMRQALTPGGEIDAAQQIKIAEVTTAQQARELAEEIRVAITRDAAEKWRRVCDQAMTQCAELLRPLFAEAEAIVAVERIDPVLATVRGTEVTASDDIYSKVSGAVREQYTAAAVGGIAIVVLPWAWPLAAAGLLWSMWRGWRNTVDVQADRAKQQLSQHLAKLLQQVRGHFLDVFQESGRASLVDEFFDTLQRTVSEQVQSVAQLKSKEAEAEVARLKAAVTMDDEQRTEATSRAQAELAAWDGFATPLQRAMNDLKALAAAAAVEGAAAPVGR